MIFGDARTAFPSRPLSFLTHPLYYVQIVLQEHPDGGSHQPVEREFREANRTEAGTRWSDEGVERVARLLEEVRLNGTKLKF